MKSLKNQKTKFEIRYEKLKEKLLKQHTRNAYIPADFFYSSLPFTTFNAPQEDIPYSKAHVIEEHVEPKSGLAVILLQAQIDWSMHRGPQYEYVGYAINRRGEKCIYRECAYQSEMRERKIVVPKAKTLLRRMRGK